jgi:hypothetical protein
MTKRCLIICQNPLLTRSLQIWLTERAFVEQDLIKAIPLDKGPESQDVSRVFEHLADWIESELEASNDSGGIPKCIALTDLFGYESINPSDLNPVKQQGGWATVLGMLILGFPEVHWIFTDGNFFPEEDEKSLDDVAVLGKVHLARTPEQLREILTQFTKIGLSPLCDGTGLRDTIRMIISRGDEGITPPRRSNLALAIDEERSYAWLHAYTAYRFGFRAQAITSYMGMEWALNNPNPLPLVVFEDYFLHFGDSHPEGMSNLRMRGERFKRLAKVANRILVTSGHHRGQNPDTRLDNPIYLRELRSKQKWNRELNKPLSGIFNLWKESGLCRRLQDGSRPGLAPEFDWPKIYHETETGHSTPGRLLVIAERLLARGERLLPEVHSVPQAVRGAVLAADALELMGGKTPTTSLEALALKHHFEALTECQFVGMQEHVDVQGRVEDIRREVSALSGWFGTKRKQKEAASWNAELSILNKLIEVYRNHNLFDEEQQLQVRSRQLHRRLRYSHRTALAKPIEIFPWYVEKLVSSFPMFVAAIVFWIVILGSLYTWVGGISFNRALAEAFTSFISIEPTTVESIWVPVNGLKGHFWLVALTMGIGFVHLGIFISHLYSIISRK